MKESGGEEITLYSVRNSVSIRLNRLSSHDSSNAVRIGSRELQTTGNTKSTSLIELMQTAAHSVHAKL